MSDVRLEFTFQSCLGKGGFGEVYLATLRRPDRPEETVAVKILKEELGADADAVARLRDEARLLTVLDHPCILRAHALCRIQRRVALVTEYLEGMDLSRCAKPGRQMPPRAVVCAIREIADALHAAWSTQSPETGRPLELIHRDVKPENLRLTTKGQVKLLDFGIARSKELSRFAQTQAGEVPFTPGYAAPECIRRGEQGPGSDVYALGASLYRLLALERLYEGVSLPEQIDLACVEKEYSTWLEERLSRLDGPPALVELTRRMLAYDRKDRPDSAEVRERASEIAGALSGPTLVEWAQAITFPAPTAVKGTTLTGKTVSEDPPDDALSLAPTPPPVSVRAQTATPAPGTSRQHHWLFGAALGIVAVLLFFGATTTLAIAWMVWR